MKHTIEFKLPKMFKKKKPDGTVEEEAVVDLGEIEEKISEKITKAAPVAVPVAIGFLIGYLWGKNRGMNACGYGKVIVIKDRERD